MSKRKSMLGVFGLSFLFISCGVSLEENEARKVIDDYLGHSDPVASITIIGNKWHPVVREGIIKIIQTTGYVYDNPKANSPFVYKYLPTEKGTGLIDGIKYDNFSGDYIYFGAVVKRSVMSIQEILIDKESKIATVKFTLKYEPIEPLYASICIDSSCRFFGDVMKERPEGTIKLKKYDKGWRRLENP